MKEINKVFKRNTPTTPDNNNPQSVLSTQISNYDNESKQ